MDEKLKIRKATPADCEVVYALILDLARFEKAADEVEMSVGQLREDAFGPEAIIEIYIASYDGDIAGMALTYEKYSTWKGKSLHLEDLIVKKDFRGKGIGSLLFEHIAALAADRKYGRMEWQVLDWNEPAIEFYKKYGATFLHEWLDCRLTREDLASIRNQRSPQK